MPTFRLVGPGRAGRSLAGALGAAGWEGRGVIGRGDNPTRAASAVDLLVLAVPDGALAEVAAAVMPVTATLVVHLSGSLGPDVLEPHPRRGAMHPLLTLPDEETGARRLSGGATFAVSGDPGVAGVVRSLGGRAISVGESSRAAYHAAACIASNHLVALLGHLERVASSSGVPLESFLALSRCALDDVAAVGPAAALTGPVSRGDWETVSRHRQVLDGEELPAYEAMVNEARRLAASASRSSSPASPTTLEVVPCAS